VLSGQPFRRPPTCLEGIEIERERKIERANVSHLELSVLMGEGNTGSRHCSGRFAEHISKQAAFYNG